MQSSVEDRSRTSPVTPADDPPRRGAAASTQPRRCARAYWPRRRPPHCVRAAVRCGGPTLQGRGLCAAFGVADERARAVDQEHPHVDVALLADRAEASTRRRWSLPWVSGRGSSQSGGASESGECRPTSATSAVAASTPTPGTVCSSVTVGQLLGERGELSVDGVHIRLEHRRSRHRPRPASSRSDIGTVRGSPAVRWTRGTTWRAPTGMKTPNSRSRPRSVFETGRAGREPRRAQPMQRGNRLLLDRLHRDGVNLLIAMRFQQALCVGAIGLVASDVAVARRARATAAPCGRTAGAGAPSGVRTRTPRSTTVAGGCCAKNAGTGRGTDAVPHQRGRGDARSRPERRTLRDRRRWSYAPSGLLLAVALKRPYTAGTMMPHGRRSPFHRPQARWRRRRCYRH